MINVSRFFIWAILILNTNCVQTSCDGLDPTCSIAATLLFQVRHQKQPRFLYVTSGTGNSVLSFRINSGTGALDFISSVPAGLAPGNLVMDSAARFLYSSGSTSNDVTEFSIDSASGRLTQIGTIAAGMNPREITIDTSSQFLIVAGFGSNDLPIFSVDQTSGVLASAGSVPSGTGPNGVAISPDRSWALSANIVSADLWLFTRDSQTGNLTHVGTMPLTGPRNVALHPSLPYAWVVDGANVKMLGIDLSAITFTTTSLLPAGTTPAIALVDPQGNNLYVANSGSDDISMFRIATSPPDFVSVGTVPAGDQPAGFVIDPTGRFAYASNANGNTISTYLVDQTGLLIPTGSLTGITNPSGLAIAAY